MRRDRQQRIALGLSVASGLTVLVCIVWLIGDFAVAAARAPEGLERVEVARDGGSRRTRRPRRRCTRARAADRRLHRSPKDRSRDLAWVLLFAGATFVASGKWYTSSRPQRLPALEALVADRFRRQPAPTAGKRVSRRAASPRPRRTKPSISPSSMVSSSDFGTSREAAIPILQAIQDHYRYLPDEALRRVCELTEITAAQLAGTSSFYAQFRRSPVGRSRRARVSRHGVPRGRCRADQPGAATASGDSARRGHRLAASRFTLDAVACLGCCSLAPVMMIEEETAGRLTPATARQALDAVEPPGHEREHRGSARDRVPRRPRLVRHRQRRAARARGRASRPFGKRVPVCSRP